MNLIREGIEVPGPNGTKLQVDKWIGRGAFSDVFLAAQLNGPNVYAIKVVRVNAKEFHDSFQNESKMLSAIQHPNVVRMIYVSDSPDWSPYLILEYANGGSLEDDITHRAAKKEFLARVDLVHLFNALVEGMKAINQVVLHRDIKLANILLHDGTPKISDFGVAKHVDTATRSTTFRGVHDARCKAPEIWLGESASLVSDIYSMGIVFYEIASLSYPYSVTRNEPRINIWQNAHLSEDPRPPIELNSQISMAISDLILRMLMKEPSDRIQTWDEIKKVCMGETEVGV